MTLHHIEVVSLKSNLSVASVVSAKSFETGSSVAHHNEGNNSAGRMKMLCKLCPFLRGAVFRSSAGDTIGPFTAELFFV